jgi:transcriptional regulator with XRE-family HTH domain
VDTTNAEFRRLLSSSGWTQSRAASELRVEPGTVSRYVSGEIRPSETVLRLFAEILGERLILAGEVIPASLHHASRHCEVYETRLLDSLRKIPPESRRRLCDAVAMIADAIPQSDDTGPNYRANPTQSVYEVGREIVTSTVGKVLGRRPATSQTVEPLAAGIAQAPANRRSKKISKAGGRAVG